MTSRTPIVLAVLSLALLVGCGSSPSDTPGGSVGSSPADKACAPVASANKLKTCVAVYDQALKACQENKTANIIPVGTDCAAAASAAVKSIASQLVGNDAGAPLTTGNRLTGSSMARLIEGELGKRGYPGDQVTCPDVENRIGVKFICVITGDKKFTKIDGSVAAGDKINLNGIR